MLWYIYFFDNIHARTIYYCELSGKSIIFTSIATYMYLFHTHYVYLTASKLHDDIYLWWISLMNIEYVVCFSWQASIIKGDFPFVNPSLIFLYLVWTVLEGICYICYLYLLNPLVDAWNIRVLQVEKYFWKRL